MPEENSHKTDRKNPLELRSKTVKAITSSTKASQPFVALLLPVATASREAARREQSMNDLKQIALSLHNYHDTYIALLVGYNADADGKALLSWRVHILQFVDKIQLYDKFHLDEPWDSPHNKKLIEKMLVIFRSPNSKAKPGMTTYLGVGGKDGVFVPPQKGDKFSTQFHQVTDGLSSTIMTVEANNDSAVIWTKPGDFAPNKKNPFKGLLGVRPGGFLAGFGDGSVRLISEGIDAAVLKAMFTKSGNEPVAR